MTAAKTRPANKCSCSYKMNDRLQKIISAAGIASRRAAEQMIREGRVTINGTPASIGLSADPNKDDIRVDGVRISAASGHRYIVLHKPRGVLTTMKDDRGRPTVAELIGNVGTRVYPAGRLDMDSEGLLILTNDGDAANALMHPKHGVAKVYTVFVQGGDIRTSVKKLTVMQELEGEVIRRPRVSLIEMKGQWAELQITIHEGKNRQIRRMCDVCGLKVTRLIRIAEGPVHLGDLPPGKGREMTREEVSFLRGIAVRST